MPSREWETDSFRAPPTPVRPFLKWAGGKRSLVRELVDVVGRPKGEGRYFEPFLGSGSVFFALQPRKAFLSDINWPLIQTFKAVKNRHEALLAQLDTLPKKPSHDHYYMERRRFNELVSRSTGLDSDELNELAALMIWLNHTCFNGLYRVNSEGKFNVPIGFRVERHIFSAIDIKAASLALRRARAELLAAPYMEVIEEARDGDVVYLDPPYQPVKASGNFTEYTSDRFDSADQELLAGTAAKLSERGCRVVISNSTATLIEDLYRDFDIQAISATRRIGSRPEYRGKVRELLIVAKP